MKLSSFLILLALLFCSALNGQIKIGDNPQTIDPASILELESSERVLVITRVTTATMNAIVPRQGALVYNTDLQCVHYYDGTQWVNLCENVGNANITADPIIHDIPTIALTPSDDGTNIEIAENSIRSEMIVDGGINGVDIQNGSIGPGKLQNNSVTQDKLSENSVGAFALDNANIGLTDFNNDAGFITNANVVSTAPNNAITNNGGAFYDDTSVFNGINDNTNLINNHITADADTNANNEIQSLTLSGNSLSISGSNTVTFPTITGEIDNNELITDIELTPANILRITEGGNVNDIDLGTLAGSNGTDGSIIDPNGGTNINITGAGTAASPYVINSTFTEVDGSISNELTDLDFDPVTNILTLTNPASPANQVDLSSLAGGGTGSTEVVDGNSLVGLGTSGDPFRINPGDPSQILVTNVGGNGVDWIDLPSGGNPAASDVTFAPTGNTISSDVQAAIEELQTEIDGISTGGAANPNDELITTFSLNGTGIDIAEGANILPTLDLDPVFATDVELAAEIAASNQTIISADTPNSISAGTDGGALYDDSPLQTSIAANTTALNAHITADLDTDNTNEIELPDDSGATVGDVLSTNGAGTFSWVSNTGGGIVVSTDTPNSITAGTDGGALYDDSPLQTNIAANTTALNAHITADLDIDDTNEIELPDDSGATAGDVLSTDGSGTYSWISNSAGGTVVSTDTPNSITAGTDGGALYDDTPLQTNIAANTTALSAHITADLDIDDTNELELPDDSGATTGDVLSTDGAGNYSWVSNAGGGTVVSSDTPNSITSGTDGGALYDNTPLVTAIAANTAALALKEDLINKSTDIALGNSDTAYPSQNAVKTYVDNQIAGVSGGQNLSNTDLTQLVGQNRTYDLNGQELIFTGSGNVGVGDFGNSGPASIRSKFDVDGQITASNGFAATEGTAGNPGYGFYTNNDTNTGMYRNAEDELSFSAGGQEIMRLEESSGNGLEITAFGSLELEDELRDITGDPGTAGQILSSTGAGVDWINPPLGGGTIVSTDSNNSIVAGGDGGAFYTDPDDDPNNEIELPAGGNSGEVLSTDGAGNYSWISGGGADGNDFVTGGSLTSESLTLNIPNQTNPSIDLSGFALDSDISNLSISGNPGNPGEVNLGNGQSGTINVEDGDSDDQNEIELPAGGNPGDILSTDGAGNYSWVPDDIGAAKLGQSYAINIRRVSSSKVAVNGNDHTLVVEGTVSQLMLPGAAQSMGQILVIKDLGGLPTSLNLPYRDLTNNLVTTTVSGGVIWLQSDGTEWQLIK